MKTRHAVVTAVVMVLAFSSAAASTLEGRLFEWVFRASMVDQDDIGESTEVDFNWSYIVDKGYIGLGLGFSYARFEFDDDDLEDSDAYSIGPLFSWNWTPQYQATGFLFASISAIGGDGADFFDYSTSIGVGVKAFVGNSAAIVGVIEKDKLVGADDFDDVDQTSLSLGLALYSGIR
ncbi:MAG: hypothetical protein ACREAA_18950 [Candidatus Polarisedimenticolia bacterium]